MQLGAAHRPGAGRSVGDAIDVYLDSMAFAELAESTAPNVRAWLAWWRGRVGERPVMELSAAEVAAERDRLRTGGGPSGRALAPATVNRALSALSQALEAVRRDLGWVEVNVARAVRRPSERGNERTRILQDEELEPLLAAARRLGPPKLEPMILVALSSGVRQGELVALRREDLDLERGTGRLASDATKNRRARTVYVSGRALEALRCWVAELPASAPLWPREDGEAAWPRKAWEAARETAGVDGLVWHDLRHTSGTWLAMLGASGPEIATHLGHRSLAMVSRYVHLAQSLRSEVAPTMVRRLLAP